MENPITIGITTNTHTMLAPNNNMRCWGEGKVSELQHSNDEQTGKDG